MKKLSRVRVFGLESDNRKSKTCTEPGRSIENPKWWGIFAIAFAFAFGGLEAPAQQPKKVYRIGFLGAASLSANSARIEALRQGCALLDILRGKTLSLNIDMQTQNPIASPRLQRSWLA
jgi:hypothetical protein